MLAGDATSKLVMPSSGRDAEARSWNELGVWVTSFAALGICRPRTRVMRSRRKFSVENDGRGDHPTF